MGKKRFNYFVHSYFNFIHFNFNIVRKCLWRETYLVAYDKKTGRGNRNFLDIEKNNCCKKETTVTSFQTVHPPPPNQPNHGSNFTDTQEETVNTPENPVPNEQ